MRAYLKRVRGITLVGKGDTNHWVAMDGGEKLGGSRAASSPMELVLIALGGCTSMDVISILDKMRVPYSDYEMVITAERAEEHPKVYTKIHIDYYIFGENIKEQNVQRAIELSQEKYCSVSAMLKPSVEITYSYHINESVPEAPTQES